MLSTPLKIFGAYTKSKEVLRQIFWYKFQVPTFN
jgi:hypothetical protein